MPTHQTVTLVLESRSTFSRFTATIEPDTNQFKVIDVDASIMRKVSNQVLNDQLQQTDATHRLDAKEIPKRCTAVVKGLIPFWENAKGKQQRLNYKSSVEPGQYVLLLSPNPDGRGMTELFRGKLVVKLSDA
jgi:asparagine synthetase A